MLLMLVSGVVLLFFWEKILAFLLKNIVPWFRLKFGDVGAATLTQLLSFITKAVHWTRQQINTGWRWFQNRFLGIDSSYVRKQPNEFVCTRTTYIKREDGKVIKIVETENLDWDTLPADVRSTLITANPSEPIEIDDKKIVETQFKNQVKAQENISDEEVLEILV
ncbi:MAG: DUF2214 family protein [Thermoguttaceae bacterium]|nr:DUF2214 family protein [Thermoguttaceae bacterium]